MTNPPRHLPTPAPPSRPRARPRDGRGFTIVESLVSVVIVATVLVASLGTVGAIGKARQVQVERAAAVHLASRVMAEIVQCHYQEPGATGTPPIGPDAGEFSRASYDDVDDYEAFQMSPPTLRGGTALSGYAGWKAKVRVRGADLGDPASTNSLPPGLKQIRVTVTTKSGASVHLFGLRSSAGAYEEPPGAAATYVTFGGVEARVGERGTTVYGAGHPLNVTSTSP